MRYREHMSQIKDFVNRYANYCANCYYNFNCEQGVCVV